MSLRVRLSSYWCAFQEYLFPTTGQSTEWDYSGGEQ